MSWRTVQLGTTLCDQDQLILNLFQDKSVRYIGKDIEFAEHLKCNNTANNLILTINHPVWVSNILAICRQHLKPEIESVYLSLNRYCVLGNDTSMCADNFIDLLVQILGHHGFNTVRTGKIERDLGRHFNFVQPLTWVYGNKITN